MARKKMRGSQENHDRWLVSYADFITLLFAFFVVMFASSQADKVKVQKFSDSVKRAIDKGNPHASSVLAAVLGGAVDDRGKGNGALKGPGGVERPQEDRKSGQVAELLPSLKVLSTELRKEIDAGRLQVSMQPRGLTISFTQAALFPSGEDAISPGAYDALDKIGEAIRKLPNPVRLEGHTDSVPIRTARFSSNWQLSAARAIAILDLLSARCGVPRDRLSVAGYADNAPLMSNDTEEGRARNRRVDIIILNETGILGEPSKEAR